MCLFISPLLSAKLYLRCSSDKPTFLGGMLILAPSSIARPQLTWMRDQAEPFYKAVQKLLGSTLSSTKIKANNAHGERGPHFPCIMGHHRQYAVVSVFFPYFVFHNVITTGFRSPV